jgi:hypothetical protein
MHFHTYCKHKKRVKSSAYFPEKLDTYVQGGQMKSGQILSRNKSKTVLNIVFKFYTLVTEYISC